MIILVACEFSGTVRRAFRERGHDAWSCDLLPADDGDPHHEQCDVAELIGYPHWDMIISFPPCTHLSVSGARYFKNKQKQQADALDFVRLCLDPPDNGRGSPRKICMENPVGVISSRIRKPDQIIQPWQFGDNASKKTCLWLRNLLPLQPTKHVMPRNVWFNGGLLGDPARWENHTENGQNRLAPSADRWAKRSLTYPGIARAMAEQWG